MSVRISGGGGGVFKSIFSVENNFDKNTLMIHRTKLDSIVFIIFFFLQILIAVMLICLTILSNTVSHHCLTMFFFLYLGTFSFRNPFLFLLSVSRILFFFSDNHLLDYNLLLRSLMFLIVIIVSFLLKLGNHVVCFRRWFV